jgi:hypothetical protein
MLIFLLMAIFLVLFFAVRQIRGSIQGKALIGDIGSGEVTYQTPVDGVRVLHMNPWHEVQEIESQERWTAVNGPMMLIVRERGFEVSSSVAVFRWLLGMQYYFVGHETSIATSRLPSHHYSKEWITISGGNVRLAIASKGNLGIIWSALMDAGAAAGGAIPIDN